MFKCETDRLSEKLHGSNGTRRNGRPPTSEIPGAQSKILISGVVRIENQNTRIPGQPESCQAAKSGHPGELQSPLLGLNDQRIWRLSLSIGQRPS